MITFDDLGRLCPTDIQLLAHNVPPDDWALALVGTSEELKAHIVDGFTIDFAASIAAIEVGRPTLRQVERIQQHIVNVLDRLLAHGHIALPS